MEIKQKLTPLNYTKGYNREIKYIVVHYFGALATAADAATYFYNNSVAASAHYLVDEKEIYQIVKDEDISWHCGDTKLGTFGGIATNANTIGIEIRPQKIKSLSKQVLDTDWYFEEGAIDNAKKLIQYLMIKYDIPIENIIRHYDVTKKYCPRPFVGDDINAYYKTTGNTQWEIFKEGLRSAKMDKEVLQLLFKELLLDLRNEDKVNTYSEKAREWGEATGIMTGGAYQGLITREEAITILYRFHLLLLK